MSAFDTMDREFIRLAFEAEAAGDFERAISLNETRANVTALIEADEEFDAAQKALEAASSKSPEGLLRPVSRSGLLKARERMEAAKRSRDEALANMRGR